MQLDLRKSVVPRFSSVIPFAMPGNTRIIPKHWFGEINGFKQIWKYQFHQAL